MTAGHSKAGTAAHGVVFLASAQVAATLLGYAIHCVATRWLTDAEYGRLAVALSVLNWLSVLVGIVLRQGLQKAVSENHSRLHASLLAGRTWYTLVVVVATGLALVSSPILARVFGDRLLLPLLLVAAAQIPLVALMMFARGQLLAVRRYGSAAWIAFLYSLARSVAACGLILMGLGAMGVLSANAAAQALAAVVALAVLLRATRQYPAEPCPDMVSRAWAWTAFALPTMAAMVTVVSLDLWLVKALVADDAAAGLYGAAVTVAALPRFLTIALGGAVFPRISHALAEGNEELARSVATESLRVLLIVFVPICAIVASGAAEITSLLFSARYARSGAPLAILMAAMSLHSVFSLMQAILAGANRPGARAVLAGALLPVAVGLQLFLIPRFDLYGAAIGSLVTMALAAGAGCVLARRYVGMTPPWWTALRCGLAGAGVYVLGCFWPADGWQVVGKLAALGAGFLAGLVLLGELRRKDLVALRRVFRR